MVQAQGKGASGVAPGHEKPVAGDPGKSGNAPGDVKHEKGLKNAKTLAPEAMRACVENPWRGNVRSLRAAIECYRTLGDRVGEGRTWRLLGHATECRTGDLEAGAALIRRSVEVLETDEPGLDLAMSYVSIASFST